MSSYRREVLRRLGVARALRKLADRVDPPPPEPRGFLHLLDEPRYDHVEQMR